MTADGLGAPFGGNENVLEVMATVFAWSMNIPEAMEMFSYRVQITRCVIYPQQAVTHL